MSTPNTPQRIVLAAAAVAVLVVAFYPPFSPDGIRSGRFVELAAVALATVGFVLALRGLPKFSLAPSGWKRLWVVISLIYLSGVTGFAWHLYPKDPSDELLQEAYDHMKPQNRDAIVQAEIDEIFAPPSAMEVLTPSGFNKIKLPKGTPAARVGEITRDYDAALKKLQTQAQLLFLIKAILVWVVPVVAVYLLAVALRWVYCGFRPTEG